MNALRPSRPNLSNRTLRTCHTLNAARTLRTDRADSALRALLALFALLPLDTLGAHWTFRTGVSLVALVTLSPLNALGALRTLRTGGTNRALLPLNALRASERRACSPIAARVGLLEVEGKRRLVHVAEALGLAVIERAIEKRTRSIRSEGIALRSLFTLRTGNALRAFRTSRTCVALITSFALRALRTDRAYGTLDTRNVDYFDSAIQGVGIALQSSVTSRETCTPPCATRYCMPSRLCM